MNKLTHEQRVQAVNCLIEGCSIRATVRMTGIAKKTIMRLLREVGEVCESYQDRMLRNLHCRRILERIRKEPKEFKVHPRAIIPLTILCQGLPQLPKNKARRKRRR